MSDILQTNIFFFITAVAVVAVTVLLVVVLVYAIRILRDLRQIIQIARHEASQFVEDISRARSRIREESARWKQVFQFLLSWITDYQKNKTGRGRKKKSITKDENN